MFSSTLLRCSWRVFHESGVEMNLCEYFVLFNININILSHRLLRALEVKPQNFQPTTASNLSLNISSVIFFFIFFLPNLLGLVDLAISVLGLPELWDDPTTKSVASLLPPLLRHSQVSRHRPPARTSTTHNCQSAKARPPPTRPETNYY